MQKLPYAGLEWVENFNIKDLQDFDDSDSGLFLEVDLTIPDNLHNKFSDLPPIPEVQCSPGSKQKKLKMTLESKQGYVIYYKNLQFLMKHGVQVTKIGKVLRFRHSEWLKPYINTNTELRTSAKSQFDKGLFKLMVNSVYGKTIENVRKHT
ncbi:DNA polymerase, partial [Bacillus cereus]|uniref:DNA polymerase n=1 Tax=Bacillus cereus TaxID=1396 RepID=UPI002B2441B9